MSIQAWPDWMGSPEDYILPDDANQTPPRVVHIGPLVQHGTTFNHIKAEEFTDGEGLAPNPFGRWTCKCGWLAEWRMGRRTVSRAMSPEASEAYTSERRTAIWHATQCEADVS